MHKRNLLIAAVILACAPGVRAGQVAVVVHPKTGSFDVVAMAPDTGTLVEARLGLDVGNQTLWAASARKATWSGQASGHVDRGQRVTAQYEFDAPRLECCVEFVLSNDGTMATISSVIRNRGTTPLKLGKCRLLEVGNGPSRLLLGDRPERTVAMVASGVAARNRVYRVSEMKGMLTSKTIVPLFNPTSQAAVLLGFLTFDRVNTEHQMVWSKALGGIELRAYCDFQGYELTAEQSVKSEKLMVCFARDPHEALATWADAAAAQYQPRIWPKIPTGWVGWSWVDPFTVERYEEVVRRNASAISRRLAGFDVEYIWVSLGNLKDVLPGNWLHWNAANFPTPPDRLAQELRRQGFKLGLWMGAFWLCTHADPQQLHDLKDSLLQRDGQPLLVANRWPYGIGASLPPEKRPGMYVLDPTHPKTQGFLREVLGTYYRWGVRYYMIDFLESIGGSTPGRFLYDDYHQRNLISGPEVYRAGLRLVREAAGKDTYILASSGPTFQSIGLVDGCRLGSDYGEGRPLAPDSYFYPATFVINRAEHWTSHRTATDTLATMGFLHRKFFLADTGNVMTLDKPCPVNEAQITATIFGINGGPMMLGDDVDRMAEDRLALVKKCLPRLPEAARALDLFDCPEPDYPKLFHLPIQRDWDRWDLLALFNYEAVPRESTVDLKRLGLDPKAGYVVWDFWNERYEGICRGTLRMIAAPRGVKLVRLVRQRSHPWLMATDMHVRQGQAEIEDCHWDAAKMTLHFRARRPRGECGNIFLLVPPGLRATNPRGLWLVKDGQDQSLIVRCALEFRDGVAEQSVCFSPTKTLNRQ